MDWLGKIKEWRGKIEEWRGKIMDWLGKIKDWFGKIKDWFAKTWREGGIAGFYEAFNSWLAKRRERVIACVRSSPDLPVLIVLAVLIWIGWEVWNWILLDLPTMSGDTPQGTGGADQQGKQIVFRSELARNLGLLAAAGIGLGFGIWRAITAYLQTKASQSQAKTAALQAKTAAWGCFAERFAAAAEHLGHESLAVRLGGLYALEALGRGAAALDVASIADVICSFVRTGPPKKDQKQGGAEDTQPPEWSDEDTGGKEEPSITEDIQVALDILMRKQTETHRPTGLRERLPEGHRLNLKVANLHGADLSGADLSGADLVGANLTGANLTGADLTGADLREAGLGGANLTAANLSGADLSGANLVVTNRTKANLHLANLNLANLTGADLTGANLTYANLVHAKLYEANLTGAYLNGANLSCANLSRADLNGAYLYEANLVGADLSWASLSKAHLYEANLVGADLYAADLRGAKNLIQEQLDSAALSDSDKPPLLPAGLKPPKHEYKPPRWMRDGST